MDGWDRGRVLAWAGWPFPGRPEGEKSRTWGPSRRRGAQALGVPEQGRGWALEAEQSLMGVEILFSVEQEDMAFVMWLIWQQDNT